MRTLFISLIMLLANFAITSSFCAEKERVKELNNHIFQLRPLHKKMGKTQPGDWLLYHKERGQSFALYISGDPVTVTKTRNKIYIQPIGKFSDDEKKIVRLTAKFLNAFYGLPVITKKNFPLSKIPEKARRVNWGTEQLLTTYILYDVLKPNLPDDAILYLGLTASDLWPGKGWNFVFGQASLREKVGVWSIQRNGNPSGTAEEFRLCLLRTLKTASHEAGHMFSIRHCTAYECGMCGSNSRPESDRRPLAFCPECHAKVIWATKTDPAKRLNKLIEFCKENKLKEEAEFYKKELKAIE